MWLKIFTKYTNYTIELFFFIIILSIFFITIKKKFFFFSFKILIMGYLIYI